MGERHGWSRTSLADEARRLVVWIALVCAPGVSTVAGADMREDRKLEQVEKDNANLSDQMEYLITRLRDLQKENGRLMWENGALEHENWMLRPPGMKVRPPTDYPGEWSEEAQRDQMYRDALNEIIKDRDAWKAKAQMLDAGLTDVRQAVRDADKMRP